MKTSIFAKLKTLQKRYEEIEVMLSKPSIIANQTTFRTLSSEYINLSEVTRFFREWKKIQDNIKITEVLLKDSEIREMAQEELEYMYNNSKILEQQLYILLLSKKTNDEQSCFIEIRAGTGGNEAAVFAGDLFRMYRRYSEIYRWNVKIISTRDAEYGGYKEVIIHVIGNCAYGRLKFESGGHRVQRVPITESQGRIHTSTCTVAVMPKLAEKDAFKINTNDLKIDTFRSSGAGGQHVNTTDSAIRVTHIPSGITVECQDERSQHKNKSKALDVLRARLHAADTIKRRTVEDNLRRNLLGTGDRSDRIRTYNFPQGRVTDHRINLTIYNLNEIMEGKLDDLINPIIQEYKADQLADFMNLECSDIKDERSNLDKKCSS